MKWCETENVKQLAMPAAFVFGVRLSGWAQSPPECLVRPSPAPDFGAAQSRTGTEIVL